MVGADVGVGLGRAAKAEPVVVPMTTKAAMTAAAINLELAMNRKNCVANFMLFIP